MGHVLDDAAVRAGLLDLVVQLARLLHRRGQAPWILALSPQFAGGTTWERTRRLPVPSAHDEDPRTMAYRLTDAARWSWIPGVSTRPRMKVLWRGERAVLAWEGLSAHWSRAMRARVTEQDWLAPERSPACTSELNPVESLWSSLKQRELANLAGDHLADVADATEQGGHRINAASRPPR
ncbi:hypothetical protein [Streptomyces mutabilis]|uniref:hypothetical protein n=1 Tax=Streptomyces mutabilis TaxID=67332 RepID=UPI0034DF0874